MAVLLMSNVIYPGPRPQFERPVFSYTELGGFSELTLDKQKNFKVQHWSLPLPFLLLVLADFLFLGLNPPLLGCM